MNISVPTIPELPTYLQPGEVMIYMDLHLIENMMALEAIDLARSLGFTPELRCKTLTRSEQVTVGIYALLHYEQREPNAELEETFFEDELGDLRERIVPDTAVHLLSPRTLFSRGLSPLQSPSITINHLIEGDLGYVPI